MNRVNMDIYYREEYGKLYEALPDCTLQKMEYNSISGSIIYYFLQRRIPNTQDIGGEFFDLITPYGYGGPLIIKAHDKQKLIQEFSEVMGSYCEEHNIVSEFIRFHPIYMNALDFTIMYDVEFSRYTIGTNLRDYEEPVKEEFSKSARREIRKALGAGVLYRFNENPQNLDIFTDLYRDTMKRNNASEFYFFSDKYFEMMKKNLGVYLLEVQLLHMGEVIGSELYLVCGRIMHAHLLGGSSKMLELQAGSLMESAAVDWGKRHNCDWIHHGGGRSSDICDPLYNYKCKFGKHTRFMYYTGKKIWNLEVYNRLSEKINKVSEDRNNRRFFPQYRLD